MERFYNELWNRWDDAAVDEVLAEDFEFRGSLGESVRGRDGWRRYRDMIRRGSRDFHNEILDVIASGNRAAVRLNYTGTHTGTLLDLEATGRRFSYAGAAFFTSSGSTLTVAWVLGDLAALTPQLE